MKSYTKGYLLGMGIANLVFSILYVIGAFLIAGAFGIHSIQLFSRATWPLTTILFCLMLAISVPLFISFFKFKKYSKLQGEELIPYKGSIITWNIVLMILYASTIVVFIFMLVSLILICIYISAIQTGVKYNSDGTKRDALERFAETTKSKLEKQTESLAQALKMKETGIITEEEYTALRKKILGIQ